MHPQTRQTFRFEVKWTAPEHEHKERSADWFWSMGIFVVSLALVFAIFGNVILSILILVSAFALSLFLNREPDLIHITLNEKGITRGHIHYPFHTLESFWIDTDHPHKKIILHSKKLLMPLIVVPIGDEIDADRIHRILLRMLREEHHALPLVERLIEYIGF